MEILSLDKLRYAGVAITVDSRVKFSGCCFFFLFFVGEMRSRMWLSKARRRRQEVNRRLDFLHLNPILHCELSKGNGWIGISRCAFLLKAVHRKAGQVTSSSLHLFIFSLSPSPLLLSAGSICHHSSDKMPISSSVVLEGTTSLSISSFKKIAYVIPTSLSSLR